MTDMNMEDFARELGHGKEHKVADGWITICPAHDDGKGSLSIRQPHGKVLFRCHAGCTQERVFEVLTNMGLWNKKSDKKTQSWKPIRPVPGHVELPEEVVHFKHGKPKRTWIYRETDGSIIGLIHRFEDAKGKTLIPMCYCVSDRGNKGWEWKSFDKPRPFYNLQLLNENRELPILVLEGEKAADRAQEIFKGKYVCTTWPGGAAAVKYADVKPFKGRTVVLWPDNDEPGFKAMKQLGEIFLSENGTTCNVVDVPEGLPQGWDIADDLPEDFSMDAHVLVSRAKPFVSVAEPTVSDLNKEFAFIITGGKPAIICEKKNPHDGSIDVEYWSVDAFRQYYANQTVPNGRNQAKMGEFWLTHPDRRTYKGLIFEPGVERHEHYNLWQGFSFEPDEAGDWSMFREHLQENVCQNDVELYNWVFGWFAHMMQFPRDKAGTSLSLRGPQGTGKTIVGKIMGRVISRHYTLIDQERYLFGNFNSHMASCILLHSDEGFWGGDPRHVGRLKSLVTSDTNRVEHKGRDSLEVTNYLRLLITTNEDWVIPAAFDERRFAVLDVGSGEQQNQQYFIDMLRQLKHGGYGGLLHELLTFDLSKTDVGKLPNTLALEQQKEISMSPIDSYWYTCLQQGETLLASKSGWLEVVKTSDLHDDCLTFLNKMGMRRMPHLNAFFRRLRQITPSDAMTRKLIGADRKSATTLPTLAEARHFFDQIMRTKHDWLPYGGDVTKEMVFTKTVDEIPF